MVPQIDFLPTSFHTQRRREHSVLWRRMMVFFFLALAMLGTWQQRRILAKLLARCEELKLQADGLEQTLPFEKQLEQRLREQDLQSQLVSALGLRVPPTRLLAAVTKSLPEFVSLNELNTEFGPLDYRPASSKPVAVAANPDSSAAPRWEQDLAELQKAGEISAEFITLHGLAQDDFAISRYLMALRETGVFERVTLTYSGQSWFRDELMRGFQLRLQVKRLPFPVDAPPGSDGRVAQGSDSGKSNSHVAASISTIAGVRP